MPKDAQKISEVPSSSRPCRGEIFSLKDENLIKNGMAPYLERQKLAPNERLSPHVVLYSGENAHTTSAAHATILIGSSRISEGSAGKTRVVSFNLPVSDSSGATPPEMGAICFIHNKNDEYDDTEELRATITTANQVIASVGGGNFIPNFSD